MAYEIKTWIAVVGVSFSAAKFFSNLQLADVYQFCCERNLVAFWVKVKVALILAL